MLTLTIALQEVTHALSTPPLAPQRWKDRILLCILSTGLLGGMAGGLWLSNLQSYTHHYLAERGLRTPEDVNRLRADVAERKEFLIENRSAKDRLLLPIYVYLDL